MATETGIRITYRGQKLSCIAYRSKERNLWACQTALCILEESTMHDLFIWKDPVTGQTEFEYGDGTIETFRSY